MPASKQLKKAYKTLNVRPEDHRAFTDAVYAEHGGLHGKLLDETGEALREHAKRLRAKKAQAGGKVE